MIFKSDILLSKIRRDSEKLRFSLFTGLVCIVWEGGCFHAFIIPKKRLLTCSVKLYCKCLFHDNQFQLQLPLRCHGRSIALISIPLPASSIPFSITRHQSSPHYWKPSADPNFAILIDHISASPVSAFGFEHGILPRYIYIYIYIPVLKEVCEVVKFSSDDQTIIGLDCMSRIDHRNRKTSGNFDEEELRVQRNGWHKMKRVPPSNSINLMYQGATLSRIHRDISTRYYVFIEFYLIINQHCQNF